MALTAMPKGWVLESGALGSGLDEDTTIYNTGGRSLRLKANAFSATRRILSEPIAVGEDSGGTDSVRRKIGLTFGYRSDITDIFSLSNFGVYFYDNAGNKVGAPLAIGLAGVGSAQWETIGFIATVPATAQFARPFVDMASSAGDLYLDYVLPYMVPPFGVFNENGATYAFSVYGAWVTVTSPAVVAADTHAIVLGSAPSGYIKVRESGIYTISVAMSFDDFAVGDSFMAGVQIVGGSVIPSGIFAPGTALASMTLPADKAHIRSTFSIPLSANQNITMVGSQLSGTFRDIVAAEMRITKES